MLACSASAATEGRQPAKTPHKARRGLLSLFSCLASGGLNPKCVSNIISSLLCYWSCTNALGAAALGSTTFDLEWSDYGV